MKNSKFIWAYVLSFALIGCGGGGSAGTNAFGVGAGAGFGSSPGGSTTPVAAPTLSLDIQRGTSSTSSITSIETVQAVGLVRTSAGDPISGVVVKFSEVGPDLVAFAPAAATALTDSSGKAVIDLAAGAPSRTGATTISATASIGSAEISNSKSIQINAGAVVAGPPPIPAAINFIGVNPRDAAIVVKGAGGSGRSESAFLTFKVVDATGAPINGAAVDFSLNQNSGGATIQPSTAVSNSDGLVTVTVASGSSPASIVVKAEAKTDSSISVASQSDTLIVSNDVVQNIGFEIAAEKYNLDGHRVGDSTTITAFARDQFGNLVADGVAINFQTNFGAVGSSTLGGCTTQNGRCSVPFYVQAPRSNSIATVVATVRVGDSLTISDDIRINMAGSRSSNPYVAGNETRPKVRVERLTLSSCKETIPLFLSDGLGHSPAAGTIVNIGLSSTGVKAAVKSGSPVLDVLDQSFPPVPFGIEIDLTDSTLVPSCKPGVAVRDTNAFFTLEFQTPRGLIFTQAVRLSYPH